MDKQMIFSFQTHKPKTREQVKKIEYFQQELSQLQEISRQCRSKSSTDMHSITTADSRQYQGYCEEVSAFVYPKKDIFAQSLNKITINQSSKETQTDTPKPKLEVLQEYVLQLQMQKEEIFNQIKSVKKENGYLLTQNKQYEIELTALKNKIAEITNENTDKEKYYQQTLQEQNWQIMQLTQEFQQLYEKQYCNSELTVLIASLTTNEQDHILAAIKEAIRCNSRTDRLQTIQDWVHVNDIKEEILQLKKSHNDKLRELMEKIKILQNDQIIEPELLSTQESLQLVSNILYRAIKSNEMLTLIKSNQRLYTLIEDLSNKLKFRLEHSNYSQQHIRTSSSLQKTDLNSTNKKFSIRKQ